MNTHQFNVLCERNRKQAVRILELEYEITQLTKELGETIARGMSITEWHLCMSKWGPNKRSFINQIHWNCLLFPEVKSHFNYSNFEDFIKSTVKDISD